MLLEFVVILWAHFIGDFVFQSDYHAKNKSKDALILAEHVLLYSIPFILISALIPVSLMWIFVNAIFHFITDFCTSKISSKLWSENKPHYFFVTIGADQAIHLTTLFVSYYLLHSYML